MHRRPRVCHPHDERHVIEPIQTDTVFYFFDVPQRCKVPFAYTQTTAHQLADTWDERGAVGVEWHLLGRCGADLLLNLRC